MAALHHCPKHTGMQRFGARSLARLVSRDRTHLLEAVRLQAASWAVRSLRAISTALKESKLSFDILDGLLEAREYICWALALLSQNTTAARQLQSASGCAAICDVLQACLRCVS